MLCGSDAAMPVGAVWLSRGGAVRLFRIVGRSALKDRYSAGPHLGYALPRGRVGACSPVSGHVLRFILELDHDVVRHGAQAAVELPEQQALVVEGALHLLRTERSGASTMSRSSL